MRSQLLFFFMRSIVIVRSLNTVAASPVRFKKLADEHLLLTCVPGRIATAMPVATGQVTNGT